MIDLTKELSTPEERAEQLRLSRNLATMFRQRAANESHPDWRAVWVELVKLHEAAVRRLEATGGDNGR